MSAPDEMNVQRRAVEAEAESGAGRGRPGYTAAKREMNRLMVRWVIVIGAVGAVAVAATWRLSRTVDARPAHSGGSPAAAPRESMAAAPAPQVEYWTCTMHPQIRASEPGDCPICGMELVAKYAGSDELGTPPATHEHDTTTSGAGLRAGESSQSGAGLRPRESAAREWYRCTMPECGDVGSDDANSRCPVCGMKRERVDIGGGARDEGGAAYTVSLSEQARRLAQVEATVAQPRRLYKRLRTVGRIAYDETRRKVASAWIGGRIDKLFADFTGMVVQKGDHLVEIYSPELLSAQEEYLQALRSMDTVGQSTFESSRRGAEQLVRSARRKLELLGISDAQLDAIRESGEPQTRLVVHAPIGGTVLRKHAVEGMYVKTGDPLYEIADLTHVWLMLELYEADLPWIRPFQPVGVTAEAFPGEVFQGRIAFVDPIVDSRTRTVKVRVNVDNPQRRLKPDMYVTAEIMVAMGPGAQAAAPPVEGEYACPMHPWETSESPAACPICEMAMAPIGQIAGGPPRGEASPLLSLPKSAVLQTGERSLVYVEVEPGTYRATEVVVGPAALDQSGETFFPVLAGVEDGTRVVTRGNFAIDSQLQLAGGNSLFGAPRSASTYDGAPGWKPGPPQPQSMHAHEAQGTPAATQPAGEPTAGDAAAIVQQRCPVMGGQINPELFVEYRGQRVYFCCAGCETPFLEDPAKYLDKLPTSVQERIRTFESPEEARP